MEAALVMPKLFTLVQEKYKLQKRVKDDIAFIYNELAMIVSAIEDYSRSSRSKDLGAVPRSWTEEVRDLAHEIEDCVDRFLYDQAAHGRLRRAPARFASEIRALKEKSIEAYKRRQRYTGGGDGAGASTSSAPADPLVLEADLVGMEEPRRELLELVQDPVEKLKVISVVGFGGLGKTLLARQVYESDVAKQFSPRAWVRAADKGAEEVLMEIRKQTGTQQGDASDVEVELLSKHLREHLHNKRYFIVIDDMRTEQWGTIGTAFPADDGVSSRIMVTTSLHTIANACSSESGHVYKMSTLDAKCSEDLFFNSAGCKERSPKMESGSAALLKKCDGLPLALVSVGQFLKKTKGSLTGTTCQDLCAKLGYHLEKDETLSRMHRVLTHNYTCLSGHTAKACLLYLGMFPSNHRIRRRTLIRRWLAEGLVVTQPRGCSELDVAFKIFEALIDRNIIQPIDVSNNEEVKTCQPPGMMLEFIVHKSVSEKFITLFCDKTSLPKYARRLSLHHNSATSVSPDNDFSLVRSLTIFGKAGQDFRKYQLLRVLDLEECNDLTDRHLKGICNLFLLRYLSLGGTITTLPRKISKLKFLETLDVRRSMVEVLLPIELIVLPNLIHLFGKFKLLGEVSSKIHNFFVSGESNLQALAGFVTNENQGLLQLMGRMKKLKKVKIWCESPTSRIDLSRAIQKYVQDGTGTTDARSLSLDFEKCSKDIMQFSLQGDCYLSSLKLHGELHTMPPFVTSLCDLEELCLSSTNLRGDLLTVLSNLRCLLFLKLAADRLENFVITDGAFPRLRRLCFVVQSSTLPEICDGALPQLLSLHLLYKDLDGLHAIKIECIKRLMEVKIDCKVKAETRKTWEDAAKKHPNRPKILFMEKVHPMEVWPTENSVVPERLEMHLAQSGKEEVHEEDTKQQEEVPKEMHLARVLPFLQGGMEAAPISASLGVMGSLLGKLDVLLAPEYRLPKEAKDGIQLLRGDLQEIVTSLVDLSEAEDPPLTAKCWMKDVRELSYDMEDYVDELLHSGADAKAGTVRTGGRFKIGRQPLIINRVSEFRSHVQEAIQRHERYNLGDCISRRRHLSVGPMLPTEYTETDDLFDGPRNELLKWLTNEEEQQLKVVSIVGSGGLGKTTLARKLYRELGGRFDCRAFLRTSQKPDMKRLLGGMLSQLRHHHQPPDACEVPELIHTIRTHLHDKRYLIVIDDLCVTSLWNRISHAFPEGNHCSRIITTTQIEEVALTCCSYHQDYILKMKRLNMDQSRKLFFTRVFGSEDDCPQQFRGISLGIIKRCGGLPLAIISIASLLASQPVLLMEQWVYIHDSLLASNLKFSTSEGMRQVLNLSYNNLPHYLKTCLLYLNTYPEDYTILKDDLVKQWVAEGFINAIEGQDVEEVAGSYFDELVNRRMIQPMDTNYKHEVFMVHGMLLDLIAYKSMEDNFSTAIDYSQNTIGLCGKVRRLSFHFGSAKYAKTPASIGLSQVRSLAFFGLFKSMPPITEFNLLRVLILQIWGDCGGTSVDLTRICELHQLRYLRIACDVSIEIPTLMQRLQCLETVEIYARLTTVPLDIVHLPRLLHLCLPGETNLLGSVGHMTSLRKLGYLDLSSNSVDTVHSLGELTNLRNLHLACCTVPSDHLERNMQCLGSILGKLSNLKSLTLVSTSSRANILVPCHGLSFVSPVPCLLQRLELLPRICIFPSLPKWIGGLGELRTLKIAVRELPRNDVDTLKRLSTLTILSLCVKEAPLQRITFHSMEFPVLRYYKFRCREACLTFEEGAMPNLRRLKLGFNAHGAEQHSRMPTGLENLLSLEELTARIGDRGATESDRRATEFALTTMIGVHRRCPRVNIFWVDWIFDLNESISRGMQEGSRILEEHGILEIEPEKEYGIAQRDEKQKYHMDEEGDTRISMPSGSRTSNLASCSVPRWMSSHYRGDNLIEDVQSGKEEVHEEDTKQQEEVPTEMHLARVLPFLQGGMKAPISASLGAMGSLLGKLDVLLAPKYRLPKKAQDGIELLKGGLQKIVTSLVDLSEAEDPPLTAKCWMKDVRELSYDMEDYVDELLHSGADAKAGTVRRGGRFKIGRLPWTLKRQPLINNRVSVFRSHVQEAIQRHERYNLGDCISRRRHLSVGPMLPTEYTETDDLFDGPMNELLKWLTNEKEQHLKVVSIVGSGGLGKTTLARKLYHKLGGFDCRAFLRTSQKPDMKRLLGGMLSQLRHHHQPPGACEVPELIHTIRTHLHDKRYLIVIDDLWATSLWNSISHAFPEGNHCSRIITTTQIEEVALTCCSYHQEYIFKMTRLNMDQSRKLFFKSVFGSEDDCPQQFRGISLGIIKRCGGLPLAIISIASLLASQPALLMEQWEYIQDSLLASNLKISTSEGMRQVLNLSYDNLPHYLKTCLLYLNTYPEDYTILKDDLVKQWVAEGFINAIEGEDVEEVAGSYFDELVNRRMIQPMDTNYKHEVFMVHGMLLDLIAYKSMEDNFSTAVDYSQNTIGLCDKVRRLSFHFGSAKYAKAPASIGLSQVRSLAFFGLFKSMPPITEFNLLRVLILQIWGDCGGTSVDLTRICELHQLRYLQIACDVSIAIPTLMQRLQCLETVEIYARLTTAQLDIVHFPRLLHLCLPGETNLLGSVGHMTSLRRLGYLDLSSNSIDTVHSLGELTNLRNLHLACCTVPSDHLESNMQCLGSILGKLSNLKSLTLVSTSRANILVPCHGLSFVSPVPCLLQRLELLPRICIFSSLPKWIGGLGELRTLKIAVRELPRNDVDTLKRLSTLTILSLCVKEAPLQRITFHSMEFPVLRYFKFRCREACLTFEEGAMPNLRRLKLGFNAHGAEQHSRMPTGLENLLSLEELTARIGHRGAMESDRRAAESALTTMIGVHRRCPGVNIFWVDWIFNLNESTSRRTQEEGSRILEEHGILEIEPEQE